MTSLKYFYKCSDCGQEYYTESVIYLCSDCKKKNTIENPPFGILKVIYDFKEIQIKKSKNQIIEKIKNLDYSDIMPIENPLNYPKLRVGSTPVYKIEKLTDESLEFSLFVKDDSQNPTFSFKDRASYLVSAYAKEHGIDTIIAASTGNAGSSLAGICASQNQKAIIFVPETAPKAKLTQIIMYGAKIIPVAGTYDDAFDLCAKVTEEFNYYNRNTAFNPLTIEGKKTVSFEIFTQFYPNLPDKILVPVGDGVIISGVYKGFEDLLELGIIEKIPIIVAVQAEGSCNLINNMNSENFIVTPSKTIADSISVDIPRNFRMAVNYLKKYSGETITVSDKEIIEASSVLSKNTGIFAEPAAATSFAGILKIKNEKIILKNEKILVMLTGSGLKDLNAVQSIVNIPKSIKPELVAVQKLLQY